MVVSLPLLCVCIYDVHVWKHVSMGVRAPVRGQGCQEFSLDALPLDSVRPGLSINL